jgi:hypothetical protein
LGNKPGGNPSPCPKAGDSLATFIEHEQHPYLRALSEAIKPHAPTQALQTLATLETGERQGAAFDRILTDNLEAARPAEADPGGREHESRIVR